MSEELVARSMLIPVSWTCRRMKSDQADQCAGPWGKHLWNPLVAGQNFEYKVSFDFRT